MSNDCARAEHCGMKHLHKLLQNLTWQFAEIEQLAMQFFSLACLIGICLSHLCLLQISRETRKKEFSWQALI